MDESNHRKWQIRIEIARVTLTLLLAIGVLTFVQHPNSILSKQKTSEDLNRERARLLIDIIQMEDLDDKRRAVEVLKYSYSNLDSDLLSLMTSVVSVEILNQDLDIAINDRSELLACLELSVLIDEARREVLQAEHDAEVEARTGAVSGGSPGEGQVYRELLEQAVEANRKVSILRARFNSRC